MVQIWSSTVAASLVIALLYSLCIHKIGLRISVHNFLPELVQLVISRDKKHA